MIARKLFSRFSSTLELPVVDISSVFTNRIDPYQAQLLQDGLRKYGALAIRDPRVNPEKNDVMIDMMERYFESRGPMLYNNQTIPEVKPENGYQVGCTPEYLERARPHQHTIDQLFKNAPPVTPQPPPKDKKWRYMWRIGHVNQQQGGGSLLADQVIPADFPDWSDKMDSWGYLMLDACFGVSEMLATSYGLQRYAFRQKMEGGEHLLAPTGSDLDKYHEVGDVLAGFHYDFSFLTIHGQSRYPGLFIWTPEGKKHAVKVPKGCLLIQAAKCMEYLTGGDIKAGFHEVVVSEATKQSYLDGKKTGKSPWRVSSTLFSGMRYDVELEPLLPFQTKDSLAKYPKITMLDHVVDELRHTELLN